MWRWNSVIRVLSQTNGTFVLENYANSHLGYCTRDLNGDLIFLPISTVKNKTFLQINSANFNWFISFYNIYISLGLLITKVSNTHKSCMVASGGKILYVFYGKRSIPFFWRRKNTKFRFVQEILNFQEKLKNKNRMVAPEWFFMNFSHRRKVFRYFCVHISKFFFSKKFFFKLRKNWTCLIPTSAYKPNDSPKIKIWEIISCEKEPHHLFESDYPPYFNFLDDFFETSQSTDFRWKGWHFGK